jgi:hypothetical protein
MHDNFKLIAYLKSGVYTKIKLEGQKKEELSK